MKGDCRLSLRHSSETPLHNERRNLVLYLARLGILDGGPCKNCEDLGQTSVAEREKKMELRGHYKTVQHCPLVVKSANILGVQHSVFTPSVLLLSHLIHILLPLRVKYWPQSDCTATVLMDAASEPLAGSVRQKAATCSPERHTDACMRAHTRTAS